MALRPPDHLVITTDSIGGIWRYCADLARELTERGSRVTLAGLGPPPSEGQVSELGPEIELAWLDAPLDWSGAGREGAAQGAAALRRLLGERQPSLLHLNFPALAPHLKGARPFLLTAHSCLGTWWHSMRKEPLPHAWQAHVEAMQQGLTAADVVVTPTASFAEALREVYHDLPAIQVVPNGSHPIRPEAKGEFLFAAGRWWDEAKNLACLDAAAGEIRWPLYAAGPLTSPESAAPPTEGVRCLGVLDHRDVAQWLARTSIFLSPARYEPFGLAVLEAANAGAALVLSDIPTFRELWEGCALFLDPRQPQHWAQAVNELIEDADAREQMGRQARERGRDFTLTHHVDGLLKAYRLALEGRLQQA